MMDRRNFLETGLKAIAAGALMVPRFSWAQETAPLTKIKPLLEGGCKPFKMKFSPRVPLDIFRESFGKDLIGRIEYFYANGFWSIEGCVGQNSPKEQMDKVGAAVEKFNLYMGAQSAMNEKRVPSMTGNVVPPAKKGDAPVRGKKEIREYFEKELGKVFEMLKRIHANSFIIGPGLEDPDLSAKEQQANVLENMKFCTELCEKNGVVMVIEPLNLKSHPGQYFTHAAQAYEVCEAIGSPSCKILYDLFHEHMTRGNLDSMDSCWKHIGCFHIADSPTRQEPGTGEIDYAAALKKIWLKGYRGCLGLEHHQSDTSKEGDIKLMQIYRDLDKYAI